MRTSSVRDEATFISGVTGCPVPGTARGLSGLEGTDGDMADGSGWLREQHAVYHFPSYLRDGCFILLSHAYDSNERLLVRLVPPFWLHVSSSVKWMINRTSSQGGTDSIQV